MPRAVFPDLAAIGGPSAFRALPFPLRADLVEQGGAVVAQSVPVAVWPADSARVDRVGGIYDHDGEADHDYLDDLIVANRQLDVEGMGSFKIVEAIGQPMLPHVALRLRSVRAGG